ncbi:hypothetical protein ACH4JZ_27090 [Streptomyces sp. NPDC017615]|uniref:hypothetical protein n=1 Tax=Streptomyces sp. NPDC017615 TaxID=3365003 RepID=UPI0037B5A749
MKSLLGTLGIAVARNLDPPAEPRVVMNAFCQAMGEHRARPLDLVLRAFPEDIPVSGMRLDCGAARSSWSRNARRLNRSWSSWATSSGTRSRGIAGTRFPACSRPPPARSARHIDAARATGYAERPARGIADAITVRAALTAWRSKAGQAATPSTAGADALRRIGSGESDIDAISRALHRPRTVDAIRDRMASEETRTHA